MSTKSGSTGQKSERLPSLDTIFLSIRQYIQRDATTDCVFDQVHSTCFVKDNEDGSKDCRHAYCARRTCKTCTNRLVNHLQATIVNVCELLRLVYHWTLTIRSYPAESQEQRLKDAFAKLRLQIIRLVGEFHYIAVVGVNRNGNLHLHVLTNAQVSKTWLRKHWHHLTGAYEIDIAEIESDQIPSASAYLLLNLVYCRFHGHLAGRKITASRSVHLKMRDQSNVDDPNPSKWERLKRSTAQLARQHGIVQDPVLNPRELVIPAKQPAPQGPIESDPCPSALPKPESAEARPAATGAVEDFIARMKEERQ